MSLLTGRMMQLPLTLSPLIRHAARHAGDVEIVSKRCEGDLARSTWRETELRARRLAQALQALGTEPGERIGTLAWNGHRHLEIYYAASGSGRVCHTINPRLFPEQIAWIANRAEDRVVMVDITFVPMLEKIADKLPSVERHIVLTDKAHMPETTLKNAVASA